jgi:hypothetical protein
MMSVSGGNDRQPRVRHQQHRHHAGHHAGHAVVRRWRDTGMKNTHSIINTDTLSDTATGGHGNIKYLNI